MIHKNAFNLRRSFGGFSKAIEEEMEWKNEHTMCVMAQLRRWKK